MSNKLAHCAVAAVVTGAVILLIEAQEKKQTLAPIGGSLLATISTNIPDMLEPAIHPHHRQFFHSFAFAALIGGGMCQLYEWEAETELEKLAKFCLLVAGGSYLIHLALDAGTKRSLPFVGRI